MPRKPIDYSKSKFYRLVCKDVTVKEVYVGHTTNEKNRRMNHKSACNNEKSRIYNLFVYKFLRDHGGWANWQLLVHETAAMKNKADASLRERYWCEHYNATLNRNVPGRTHSEYCAAHVEKIKARKKKYNAAHVDEIKANKIEYRKANLDKIKITMAKYCAANVDRLREKHDCQCGGCYTTQGRLQHFKTAKHLAFVAK
jgi:hypothetical protein